LKKKGRTGKGERREEEGGWQIRKLDVIKLFFSSFSYIPPPLFSVDMHVYIAYIVREARPCRPAFSARPNFENFPYFSVSCAAVPSRINKSQVFFFAFFFFFFFFSVWSFPLGCRCE
jgi:hypothetical protein